MALSLQLNDGQNGKQNYYTTYSVQQDRHAEQLPTMHQVFFFEKLLFDYHQHLKTVETLSYRKPFSLKFIACFEL